MRSNNTDEILEDSMNFQMWIYDNPVKVYLKNFSNPVTLQCFPMRKQQDEIVDKFR